MAVGLETSIALQSSIPDETYLQRKLYYSSMPTNPMPLEAIVLFKGRLIPQGYWILFRTMSHGIVAPVTIVSSVTFKRSLVKG